LPRAIRGTEMIRSVVLVKSFVWERRWRWFISSLFLSSYVLKGTFVSSFSELLGSKILSTWLGLRVPANT